MGEITLPVELASGNLSLPEIGVIFVLYSAPKLDAEVWNIWNNDECFQACVKRLMDVDVLKLTPSSGGVSVEINLGELKPK
jgi:hypothetical protein